MRVKYWNSMLSSCFALYKLLNESIACDFVVLYMLFLCILELPQVISDCKEAKCYLICLPTPEFSPGIHECQLIIISATQAHLIPPLPTIISTYISKE